MSGSSAPSAPDYGPLLSDLQAEASTDNSLANQQMGWAENAYAQSLPITNEAVSSDQGTSNTQSGIENSIDNQYETTYQPLENQFANEAQNYTSSSNIDQQMGRSEAAAANAGNQALVNEQYNLEAYGISPDSTRYQALNQQGKVQNAASVAAAGNQAYQNTVNTGLGLQSTAIAQGEVMPSMAAGAGNVSLQGNAGAVNSDLATTAEGASTMGTAPTYYNLANTAYGAYGNTLNTEFQNELASYQANQTSATGLGGLFGAMLGGGGSLLKGLGAIGLSFAEGGTVPAVDDGDVDPSKIRPFNDKHFYAMHAFDEQGKKFADAREAAHHFFKTGKHIGTFKTAEHAHAYVQKQAYGKVKRYAAGGAVDATDGGAVPPGMSPSRGAVTDDVPAVTDQGTPLRLNAYEQIIPKDVALWKGQEFFQKLINQSRQAKAAATSKPQLGPPLPGQTAQQGAVQ